MRLRITLSLLAVVTAAFGLPLVTATPAHAHGWITTPPSRQDHCAKGRTSFDCGPIKYEPQSVEAVKGRTSCSGGSAFRILDESSRPWPVTSVGSTVTFRWNLTAAHNTSTWEYSILGGRRLATFNQNGQQPPSNISHTVSGLPSGRHTILAVWNISNTVNAFYNCIDVQVNGGGGGPQDPPGGGDNCAGVPTYSSSAAYTGGQRVRYNGRLWQAKWWTQGEAPSTGGSGVWMDQGTCGSAAATPEQDMSGQQADGAGHHAHAGGHRSLVPAYFETNVLLITG
jgi:predicted carbohydrate-binding protein with CBM5 and CBM33 domain